MVVIRFMMAGIQVDDTMTCHVCDAQYKMNANNDVWQANNVMHALRNTHVLWES